MIFDILRFLNENAGAVGVVFSGLVTIATIVYAILTWALVSETRRMRKAQTDAKVTVRVQPQKDAISLMQFVVANEGVGPAYDTKFKIVPVGKQVIDDSVKNRIESFGFFNQGLEYLSPNQEIVSYLTSMHDDFDSKIKTSFNIKVSYKNSSGKKAQDSYFIDFSIFSGLVSTETLGVSAIAKELKKIQKDFHKIATGFNKLRVITQTKEGYNREQQEIVDEAKQRMISNK